MLIFWKHWFDEAYKVYTILKLPFIKHILVVQYLNIFDGIQKSRLLQIEQNQGFLVYFTKVLILSHDSIIYVQSKSLSKNNETGVQEDMVSPLLYIAQCG